MSSDPRAAWWRCFLTDALLLLVLLVLSVKMTHDVSRVRDLCVLDEASYMHWGSQIPERGLPDPEYCPLYCLWYYLLSRVQPDRVRLYYLNWQLLTFLLPASLFVLGRTLRGGRAASLLTAFVVLGSAVVEVWPYPSYLACSLLALGTALASRARSWSSRLAVLGLTLVVSSYVRPELAVSFLLLCLAVMLCGAWTVLRGPGQAGRLLVPTVLVVACATLLLCLAGNPLRGGRPFIAFAQHYTRNLSLAGKVSGASVVALNHALTTDFGKATTVSEACQANPSAVLWHVSFNARQLPTAVADLLEVKLDLGREVTAGLVMVLLGAAGLGAAGLVRRCQRDEDRGGLFVALLMLALLLVPTTVSVLLIAPRSHYLMPAVLFLIVLAGAGLAGMPRCREVCAWLDGPVALLVLCLALLAVTPNRAHGWSVQALLRGQSAPSPLLQEQKTVAALQRLPIRGPAVVLDYTLRSVYARFPSQVAGLGDTPGRFWEFVRQANVGIIVLDPFVVRFSPYCDDLDFQEFVAEKRSGDFKYFTVSGVQVRIAVRKDLLAESGGTGSAHIPER